MNSRFARRLFGLWPPYFGAGVRVRHIADDWSRIEVEMKLRFWNRNYVGTHFGGSLFSMTDPFYMIMLMQLLGAGYTVWDKAATIRYRRPGRGTVRAIFEISEERLREIREQAAKDGRTEPHFKVEILDGAGELVAEVEKVLSVKKTSTNTRI